MMARKVLMLGNSHTAASRIALLRPSRRLARIQPDVLAMPGDTWS
ncbi:hypothetical protein O4J55_13015 [Paracoccus sp. PXZ]